jgi:hypothetical protein
VKTLCVILLMAAAAAAQQPDIPAVVLTYPVLTVSKASPVRVEELGRWLNRLADLEARILPKIDKHHSVPENYLHRRLLDIRRTAKTDPEQAAAQVTALIEQFRGWGCEL